MTTPKSDKKTAKKLTALSGNRRISARCCTRSSTSRHNIAQNIFCKTKKKYVKTKIYFCCIFPFDLSTRVEVH